MAPRENSSFSFFKRKFSFHAFKNQTLGKSIDFCVDFIQFKKFQATLCCLRSVHVSEGIFFTAAPSSGLLFYIEVSVTRTLYLSLEGLQSRKRVACHLLIIYWNYDFARYNCHTLLSPLKFGYLDRTLNFYSHLSSSNSRKWYQGLLNH